MKIDKHWAPFFIAAAIAIIAVIYYIVSGYSSYDLNVRQLNFGKTIDKIDASNTKKILIKCKNGESYEIAFKQEQQNYANLIFNACGPEGSV